MARLWRNECMRVFYDRLIDDKDRELVARPPLPPPTSDRPLNWWVAIWVRGEWLCGAPRCGKSTQKGCSGTQAGHGERT